MPTTFHIRPAAAGDFPAITAIYAEAVRTGTASFELDPPDEGEMLRRFSTVRGLGAPYLVGCGPDGGVLGYAYANAYRSRPAYRFTVEDSIYLAPQARGRGIGKALLERLVADCAAGGFRQMIAVIGDSARQVPSIRLHTAVGFHMVGPLAAVGWKNEQWLDTVLMQRALGPGEEAPPPAGR